MKMTILLIMLFGISTDFASAQSETVYLICQPTTHASGYNIRKFVSEDDLYQSQAITYGLIKDRACFFFHFIDYDVRKLAQRRRVRSDDYFERAVRPVSFLDTISPIDLNAMLPDMTEASAKAFIDRLSTKKVFMIDRSEIGPDSLVVRQVRCRVPRGW